MFGQLKPKLIKEFKMPINWGLYSVCAQHRNVCLMIVLTHSALTQPLLRILVASIGGRGGNLLQVFYFKKDSPVKLQRFEIELANDQDLLLPKDLFLAKMYVA